MEKIVINSINTTKNGNGTNIAFSYSKIDSDGNLVKNNERASFIVVDDTLDKHIMAIEKILENKVK